MNEWVSQRPNAPIVTVHSPSHAWSAAICGLTVQGEVEVAALGQLDLEDQVFVTAFLRSHGSIKRMEALFGISYPTVKNRLNRIVNNLDAS